MIIQVYAKAVLDFSPIRTSISEHFWKMHKIGTGATTVTAKQI